MHDDAEGFRELNHRVGVGVVQEANNLRVKVAKVTLNAQLAEKIQYDLVQQVRAQLHSGFPTLLRHLHKLPDDLLRMGLEHRFASPK